MERGLSVPRHHSRVAPTKAILEFFRANPDEELTQKDIEVKFELRGSHAYWAVKCLCELGELNFRREGVTNFYRNFYRRAS